MHQSIGYSSRHYFTQGVVEGRAYFVYILSAESINQRSFLPATHGTRFAWHRSVERIQNLLMFVFCHGKEFYQVAHVAGRRVPRRSSPRQCASIITFRFRSRFQPWLKDMEIAKAGGPCKECPATRADLFGTLNGQRTDVKCWRRKMGAFIAINKDKEQTWLS